MYLKFNLEIDHEHFYGIAILRLNKPKIGGNVKTLVDKIINAGDDIGFTVFTHGPVRIPLIKTEKSIEVFLQAKRSINGNNLLIDGQLFSSHDFYRRHPRQDHKVHR